MAEAILVLIPFQSLQKQSMHCFQHPTTAFWTEADLPRVKPEQYICRFCHPKCGVHDPADLKLIYLHGDSNHDLLHDS